LNQRSAAAAARSGVRRSSSLLSPTETLLTWIALILRMPMSVQRHVLPPNRNVPLIVKSPCIFVYPFMIGAN
jgi:hypothetical protein